MYVKRNTILINIVLLLMVTLFLTLKLYNVGVINIALKNSFVVVETTSQNLKVSTTLTTPQAPIPWRFQIEEDGFFFPDTSDKEKYISYERINGPITKQITIFENAVIFAYITGRTLLVPKLKLRKSENIINQKINFSTNNNGPYFNYSPHGSISYDYNKNFVHKAHFQNNLSISLLNEISMSEIIDFDLLSTQIKLKALEERNMSTLTQYKVCQDPHLGFWVDYIPSVENIQTWRILKQQYFYPLKLKITFGNKEYVCPGTKEYMNRWGPPLRTKPLYRGIITELVKRKEDLIFFQGDTLDTTQIRFFNQQRTQKAQEILLFYIRFSRSLTQKVKEFVNLLEKGYSAILAEGDIKPDGLSLYISNEADRLNLINVSSTVFIVCNASFRNAFNPLQEKRFTLIFADDFINNRLLDDNTGIHSSDYAHIISLMLCAHAKQFISLPGTHDLYFVEHLRLQDATMLDGLVTNKISVRWAKHTIRHQADDLKVLMKIKTQQQTTLSTNTSLKSFEVNTLKTNSSQQNKTLLVNMSKKSSLLLKKRDKLTSMACIFCNYVRYVTGLHGCPAMKQTC
ncbi:uncharacterized protein LOC124815876 isoform X2 [Hydra vulgaris]|uniref:Uncharacterized protein LOC124815876 isoform X2 n=1 Tax=Hydra vulgaris TaxID=6087 RepID=A0ABM4DDJ7_HYDVU